MSKQQVKTLDFKKIIDKYEDIIFDLSCKLQAKDMIVKDYEQVLKILGTAVRNSKEREVVYQKIIDNVNTRQTTNLINISDNPNTEDLDKASKARREKRVMEIYNETNRIKDILKNTLGTDNLDEFNLR